MDPKDDKDQPDEWLRDLPLRSKTEGFEPGEMIACPKCGRKNPPIRLDCMYCSAELEFDENQRRSLKPVVRKAEAHMPGHSLIYLANLENWDERQLSEVARMTRLADGDLAELVGLAKALPLARSESAKEVSVIGRRMAEEGIETGVIADEALAAGVHPRRLRGLRFGGGELVLRLFNSDEEISVGAGELAVVVVGAVYEKKLESLEKRRKNEDDRVLEAMETSSDDLVLDIYRTDEERGYRLTPNGFDFSCLGEEKQLLAADNMRLLTAKLKEFAGAERFDADYPRVRHLLSQVWEIDARTDSRGIERKSFSSYGRRIETTTSNLSQFTRYSRLQWVLRQRPEILETVRDDL